VIPIPKRQRAPTFFETLRSLWRARRHLWSLFSELGEHTTAWSYAMIATANGLEEKRERAEARAKKSWAYLDLAGAEIERKDVAIITLEAQVAKLRRPKGRQVASSLEPDRLHAQLSAVRAEAPPITNNAITEYLRARDADEPAAIPGLRVQPHEGGERDAGDGLVLPID